MDIALRLKDAPQSGPGGRFMRGRWRHYCLKRRAIVLIESDDIPYPGMTFCPLCGAACTDGWDGLPGVNDVDYVPDYDGPRCVHRFPDRSCADLVALAPHQDQKYRWSSPEYRALRSAPDLELKALRRWARPCRICTNAFLAGHYGLLESELMVLCERLSVESRDAQERVLRLEDDVSLAFNLLSKVRDEAEQSRGQRIATDRNGAELAGYVYAISDGTAIKIGFSSVHPSWPNGRLAQLQTACPTTLSLIGAFVGTVDDERNLHGRFAEHRLRGEWFAHVSEIVGYFDKP